MAKRRARRHSRKRRAVVFMGGATRSHRRHRRARRHYGRSRVRRVYMGGAGGASGPVNLLIHGGAALAGGLLGSFIGGKIPAPEKIKPIIPILAGIVLPMIPKIGKNPLVRSAAVGMIALGGVSLVKAVAPGFPLLAGDHTDLLGASADMSGDELAGLAAEAQQLLGAPAQFAGDELMGAAAEYTSGADVG